MSDHPTAAEHLRYAQEAYENRDYEVVAAESGMAACGLLAELLTLLNQPRVAEPEPAWQRHDQVRHRSDEREFIAILQVVADHPLGGDERWWSAQVMRMVSGIPVMVGSTVLLKEGSPNTAVARFPD